jgi:hypothetical protein
MDASHTDEFTKKIVAKSLALCSKISQVDKRHPF